MFDTYGVDLVFDIGAAKGDYGRELRTFGYRGQIVSFEPLAAAHEQLSRASASDPHWDVHRCALGASTGTAVINVASNSDSSSLLPLAEGHRKAAPQVQYVGGEEIRLERLDDLAPQYLGPQTRAFAKLDTQGFEAEVMAGGAETLARCVGLQIELSFVPLYEGDKLVDEMMTRLYREGFRLTGIEQGFTSATGETLQSDGIFFRPESAVSR
jgi:FkbM family methyltransferase